MLPADDMAAMKLVYGFSISMPINVPMILNSVCRAAVRLAASEPPSAARIPVTVVPMFAPNMKGREASRVSAPA